MASKSTIHLPLFPLLVVLYPGMHLPLHIFEERYKRMIGECVETKTPFGVVLVRRGHKAAGPTRIHPIGTLARIEEVHRLEDGRMNILAVGEHRFVIRRIVQELPFMRASVSLISHPQSTVSEEEVRALSDELARLFADYDRLMAQVDEDWKPHSSVPRNPIDLAYAVAAAASLPYDRKQELLSELYLDALLKRERDLLSERCYELRAMLAARSLLKERQKRFGPMPEAFHLN